MAVSYKTKVTLDVPEGKILLDRNGKAYIKYNPNFKREMEKNLGKLQEFIDMTVRNNLMAYVSFRTGTQEKSIKLSTMIGSGQVIINVPYAKYQAYSKKIKKRVGKRGTYPFERMKADKKESILRQGAKYSQTLDK